MGGDLLPGQPGARQVHQHVDAAEPLGVPRQGQSPGRRRSGLPPSDVDEERVQPARHPVDPAEEVVQAGLGLGREELERVVEPAPALAGIPLPCVSACLAVRHCMRLSTWAICIVMCHSLADGAGAGASAAARGEPLEPPPPLPPQAVDLVDDLAHGCWVLGCQQTSLLYYSSMWWVM